MLNNTFIPPLHKLMVWPGHRCPRATLHYIRIRLTRLAGSFVKADKISHKISMLINHDRNGQEGVLARYYKPC